MLVCFVMSLNTESSNKRDLDKVRTSLLSVPEIDRCQESTRPGYLLLYLYYTTYPHPRSRMVLGKVP
jgi:hypothetical protein